MLTVISTVVALAAPPTPPSPPGPKRPPIAAILAPRPEPDDAKRPRSYTVH